MVYSTLSASSSCEYMSATFVHNEEFILTCSSEFSDGTDGTIFDSRSGSVLVPRLGLHQNSACRSIAASPSDKTFLTGGDDFKVRYVDIVKIEEDSADTDMGYNDH